MKTKKKAKAIVFRCPECDEPIKEADLYVEHKVNIRVKKVRGGDYLEFGDVITRASGADGLFLYYPHDIECSVCGADISSLFAFDATSPIDL